MALIQQLKSSDPGGECFGEKRNDCIGRVERIALQLTAIRPDSSLGPQMKAQLLLALGQARQASESLSTACDNAIDRLDCCKLRLSIARTLQDQALIDQLLKFIAAFGCTDTPGCVETWMWIGNYHEGAGNVGAAANAYEKAAARKPGDAAIWIKLGDVASKIGAHARAIHAYERASACRPDDAAIVEKLNAERLQLMTPTGSR
jgi:tetratricopeptide (TPR) repeat protein